MGRNFVSIAVASSGFLGSGRGTEGATGVWSSDRPVKPFPSVDNVGIIGISNLPVALAITAITIFYWVLPAITKLLWLLQSTYWLLVLCQSTGNY